MFQCKDCCFTYIFYIGPAKFIFMDYNISVDVNLVTLNFDGALYRSTYSTNPNPTPYSTNPLL